MSFIILTDMLLRQVEGLPTNGPQNQGRLSFACTWLTSNYGGPRGAHPFHQSVMTTRERVSASRLKFRGAKNK